MTPALVMALVPVELSVPDMETVPLMMLEPIRSMVEPLLSDTVPLVLVTVSEVSFSVELSIA